MLVYCYEPYAAYRSKMGVVYPFLYHSSLYWTAKSKIAFLIDGPLSILL